MAAPAPPPASPAAAPNTRPASLWPDTQRLGDGGASTQFELSHFDPLQPLQAQRRERLAARFDLCRPALGLRVLLFLQLTVALAALPAAAGVVDWALRAIPLAFVALAGGLLWLPAVCGLQRRLLRWSPVAGDAVVAGLGAAAALAGWAMVALLGLAPQQAWSAAAAAACGAALAALVWHWLGLRGEAARPLQAAARLAELQSRIRPHFLFNALNTALALVRVDPGRAEGVLEDLAQLFRVALAEAGSAVSLDEEIELAQRYLAIEQLRFGPRLQVAWDLDPAAAEARVPPLVLQPLVENAVRHGIEPALGGGRLQVRTRLQRGMVEIEVGNTLPDEPGPRGSGLALANVRERLRLLHDLAASLDAGPQDGRWVARIVVPL